MKWYLAILLGLVTACAAENKSVTMDGEKAVALANEIRIVNEKGVAVANARVMIGYSEGAFPHNVVTTDQNGTADIPAGWVNAEPVTIIADTYITATYLHQRPLAQEFVINTARGEPTKKVQGVTTGFGELRRDDKIDFGLVLPLMPKTAYFQFDLGLFISPDSDVIEIMGNRMNVPSNVSLPDQSERYLLFNIRFNKPQYRVYFHEEGNYNLITSHGRFPFRRMIDEFQDGKGFTEVVNLFDFLEGGLHAVTAPGDANLAINNFQIQGSMPVRAPQIPQGFSYFASSLQTQNNLLYPADVKRLASNEALNLKMSPVGVANVLLAAVAKEEKLDNGATRLNPSMSISIHPYVAGQTQTYLPLVSVPQVANNIVTITPPNAPDFRKIGTYISLQDVRVEMAEESYNEYVEKKWEIYSNQWESQVRLPQIGQSPAIANHTRWESLFLASKASQNNGTGPAMFNVAEYVSRNATPL
jgi:hypothetical protein